ncbi:unnamed protein product, partial [Iphiclides podalirius]
MRLLWREKRFFEEEHSAHAMSAVLRALTHYAAISSNAAVDGCLHFLCDLLNGISLHDTASPLSHQSAYSVEQLLACINALMQCVDKKPNGVLCVALVLHALISHQPPGLVIRATTANALLQVLRPWSELFLGALNHSIFVDDTGLSGMLLVVTSQIATDTLRNDPTVRKVSTLVLGEMLKVLAERYLYVNESDGNEKCAKDIHLSQWLKTEDSLPDALTGEFEVLELLLSILVQCEDRTVVSNCMATLSSCLEQANHEFRQTFAALIWSKLPEALSRALIDYGRVMVLLTYTNREAFLPNVLSAANSSDGRVASAALHLLTHVIHCFTKNSYQDSEKQANGWKTLSSVFKHAVVYKRDANLVAALTSQPWTHTLVRFQLSQGVTGEFLSFAHNWLTLLQITIRKSLDNTKRYVSKYSPVTRTLILMKKHLDVEDETLRDVIEQILRIIDSIASDSSIKIK